MANLIFYRTTLLFLLIPLSILTAQNHTIENSQFANLYNTAAACLDSTDGDCTAAFEMCIGYLNKMDNDTLAGNYFLELGNIRMRRGRWGNLSRELFEAADRRFAKAEIPCLRVKSRFALTKYAKFKGETDSMHQLATHALEAARACGDRSKIAGAENFMAGAYVDQSAYNEGLNHFHRADEIYSELGDSLGLATVMLDMSEMYSQMHEKEKARGYTFRAAQLFKAAGEDMRYAIALIDFSADLVDVQLADSSLVVLPIAEKIVRGKNARAEAYMEQNYGGAYYLKKEYRKAIEHYKKGLSLNKKVGDSGLALLLNIFISENYLELNAPDRAHQYALRADSIAGNMPRNFKRSQAYLALAESAYSSKHYDLSYLSFKRFIVLRDSLLGVSKRQAIAELENSYEAEKKEKQIELAGKENALLEVRNKAATNRNYALSAGLILLLVIGFGIISRKNGKLKIQKAKMMVDKLENEKLNQELAHRKRELSSKALYIARNNEVMSDLKNELQNMSPSENQIIKSLTNRLKIKEIQDKNWDSFIGQFTELNPKFYRSLTDKYGTLTKGEMRLAALIKMGIATKDIAIMLNISEQGVKKARHRLRKKLDIESTESLENAIIHA